MSWSAFWAPVGEAIVFVAQVVLMALGGIAIIATACWLVVALLTVGDMVRSGEIGRWRK